MKKAAFLALGLMICIAVPSFAQSSSNSSDIKSDAGAIAKDNQALSKDDATLAANRAAKAQDKAQGNTLGQAYDSVKIGANQATASEKKTEKDADKKILNHDAQ